jgi:hypothetical protein
MPLPGPRMAGKDAAPAQAAGKGPEMLLPLSARMLRRGNAVADPHASGR